jgi:hypothetical protein
MSLNTKWLIEHAGEINILPTVQMTCAHCKGGSTYILTSTSELQSLPLTLTNDWVQSCEGQWYHRRCAEAGGILVKQINVPVVKGEFVGEKQP